VLDPDRPRRDVDLGPAHRQGLADPYAGAEHPLAEIREVLPHGLGVCVEARDLWNASDPAIGCSTTGASEACMLAGLALKRRGRSGWPAQAEVHAGDEPARVADQDDGRAELTVDRIALMGAGLLLGADDQCRVTDDPDGNVEGEVE
jgi:hypothetical protein